MLEPGSIIGDTKFARDDVGGDERAIRVDSGR